MKKLAVISDLHCGHRAGLTAPGYWYTEGSSTVRDNFAKIQRSLWKWYADEVAKCQPVDLLVVNGDAIDGKAERSGGTELITADRDELPLDKCREGVIVFLEELNAMEKTLRERMA